MARRLVVEAEIGAGVPDFAHTRLERNPAPLACVNLGERPLLLVCRLQGIAREQVFYIGQDEFLMLLFMVQSELD